MHLFKGSLALPTGQMVPDAIFGCFGETFLRIAVLYIETAAMELKKRPIRAQG
jgi:hypothetical protein